MIIDTDDDRTCDFSVINDSVFTRNMNASAPGNNGVGLPTEYRRDMFTRQHGHRFDGLVTNMFHQRLFNGIRQESYLHGISDNGRIFRMKSATYEIVAENLELFYDQSVNFKPEAYIECAPYSNVKGILINDGDIYKRTNEVQGQLGMSKFGLPKARVNGTVRVTPPLCGNEELMFYSPEEGKFFWADVQGFRPKDPPEECWYDIMGGAFDPSSQPGPGYEVVYCKEYSTLEFRFLMRKDDHYVICVIDRWDLTGVKYVDISDAPEIKNAISHDFLLWGNKLFYATSERIYSVRYTSEAVYEEYEYDPGEPITGVYMLRGSYDGSMQNSAGGIIVTTYNGTEGKVHFLLVDPYTGAIVRNDSGMPPIKVFGGFKKIIGIASQDA